MGSSMTAPTWSVTAAFNALISPKGTWRNPGITGSKPARYLDCPVAASVAKVLPWKDSLQVMMTGPLFPFVLKYLRTSLMAPSLASAPECRKRPGRECVLGEDLRHQLLLGNLVKVRAVEEPVCLLLPVPGDTLVGCPRLHTAIPATMSRYCLPASSKSTQPSPLTTLTGCRA
jgi:hypothetical protein